MPKFSTKSKQILASVHPDLRRLFETVVERFDCTIVSGHRNEAEQNEKFRQGLSKVQYPDSKHNAYPSNAVDVAPYPIDWEDRERFAYFAGYVMGVAQSLGITIRWGGDFDMDTEVKDSTFYDGGHFELKD